MRPGAIMSPVCVWQELQSPLITSPIMRRVATLDKAAPAALGLLYPR